MSKTIRKTSTEFAAAVAGAKNVKVFSLDNDFSGAPAPTFPKWIGEKFQMVRDGARYTARVHSNLWVEFEVAA